VPKVPSRLYLIIGTVVAALSVIGIVTKQSVTPASIPAYTVSPVTRGDITQSVAASGQLFPFVSVEVSSQISGLVTEVNVDYNSVVKKGQVLAKIDPSTYQQKLRQAKAELEAARASHALAELNVRRLRELRDEDLVTQQDFDQAAAQLQQLGANLLTQTAAVENARVDLARCTITSPIDGIVIFRQIEVGKTVVSSFSAPTLFTIAQDLSKMRIIAQISEVDVGLVHLDQAVTFTIDAIRNRVFSGRIIQIRNPYTPQDQQKLQTQSANSMASFDAVIEVDNPSLMLRPSLTANVEIVVSRRRGVLRVPNSALRIASSGQAAGLMPSSTAGNADTVTVYRLKTGDRKEAPEAVQVRIGMSDSGLTEILTGLEPGDSIVTGIATKNDFRASNRSLF
jgi:HlyD family secretion protein